MMGKCDWGAVLSQAWDIMFDPGASEEEVWAHGGTDPY